MLCFLYPYLFWVPSARFTSRGGHDYGEATTKGFTVSDSYLSGHPDSILHGGIFSMLRGLCSVQFCLTTIRLTHYDNTLGIPLPGFVCLDVAWSLSCCLQSHFDLTSSFQSYEFIRILRVHLCTGDHYRLFLHL